MTEVLDTQDERVLSKKAKEAKQKETNGLLDRGVFMVILREEFLPNGNVLPGRFVLAIKSNIDGSIKYKARYVIRGHKERMKNFILHTSTILQPQSVRLLLALAVIFIFDV